MAKKNLILPRDSTGGGGGGGGGGFQWTAGVSNPSPALSTDNNQQAFSWIYGDGQHLYGVVKVPASYVAGSPIKMKLECYSASTSNNWQLISLATLLRPGTDAASSTTNQYTSTTSAVTNGSPSNKVTEYILDLTSSSGQVNSVAVAAGHVLNIDLYRSGSDTNTADLKMKASSVEITFS